ncbi:MAG: MMPL family transporter, partial [Deltaproteobacteria bacterium]|nr:MMPL family transporter [Deltaproteobacteria bacterium]
TKLTIFFTDHTSDNLLRVHAAAKEFFSEHPAKIDSGEFLMAGGAVGMEIAINEEMMRTHTMVDLMVLGTIFILCGLFYRSFLAGALLTGPLVLGNFVAFCYMAMNGIGLSINTLPVAAVGAGVGVDFAIYIYNRCKEEFDALGANTGSASLASDSDTWKRVVLTSVRTSGKAVLFTGLTMVLPILSWLVLSDLKFQAQMGMFLAMILTTNVLLALTLHPLMLYLIKPRFISRGLG